MGNKEALADDVYFILKECARIASLPYDARPAMSLWATLPHPSGRGDLECGDEAWKRIEGLAAAAGALPQVRGRVSQQSLILSTKRELVERFLKRKRPIDAREIDKLLSAVAKGAKRKCSTLVHFIPCHLMASEEPDQFDLGPVKFRRRSALRQALREVCRGRRLADEQTGPSNLRRDLLCLSLRYYRSFQWVAVVRVEDCDPDTSEAIATRAVTSALDCLHLLFGAFATDRMRLRGPAVRNDVRATLVADAYGNLHSSVLEERTGQGGFGPGWSKSLAKPEIQKPLEWFAVALEAVVDPSVSRPLSRRFLNAVHWYGEAVRQERGSTRVVQFATALETMMMTGEVQDITVVLSKRSAAFLCDPREPGAFGLQQERVRRFYKLRSKIVHGELPPRDVSIGRGVVEGAELCREALLNCLDHFGPHLRRETVKSSELEGWFNQVTANCEREASAALMPPS